MHEYRLYTSIPSPRQTQILNIFAGLTASQPVPVTTQVIIYQQLRAPPNAAASKKGLVKPPPGQQQQRLHYVKLVRDVTGEGKWRLREEGSPDPAAKTVISQPVVERELETKEDMQKFRPGSEWHKYISQYTSSGVRFIHQNVIITMTRIYTPSASTDPLDAPPPASSDLKYADLLDASGAWLLEVCLRVDDGGNTTLRDRAVKELEGLRRELEGAVDLRVPDRLSLDSRVR